MGEVKIENVESFKQLWLNEKMTPKEIADHFRCSRTHVHQVRIALGLPPKGTRGFGMVQSAKRKGERSAQKFFKFLKNEGGFCPVKLLTQKFSPNTFAKMRLERRLFVITFNFGRSTGANHMRRKHNLIFNQPYIYESYACNSRTAVIRLMTLALKKPDTEHLQKTVTSFLRNYLTDAEYYAVMWRLGKRKWDRSQVKGSIQIDGIIKPVKRASK